MLNKQFLLIISLLAFVESFAQRDKAESNAIKTVTTKNQSDIKESNHYILKLNPFSPLNGHTQFGVERQLNRRSSAVLSFSIIGAGINAYNPESTSGYNTLKINNSLRKNQFGFSIGASYKLFLQNQAKLVYQQNNFPSGFFVGTTLYMGRFKYTSHYIYQDFGLIKGSEKVNYAALIVEPGFQFAITRNLNLEIYSGIGYAIDNQDPIFSKFYSANYGKSLRLANSNLYSVMRVPKKNNGLAISGGLKLGWVIL